MFTDGRIAQERLSHLRAELIAVTKDNTNKVGVIQMLKNEKRHLDKGLNFVRKAVSLALPSSPVTSAVLMWGTIDGSDGIGLLER